MKILTHKVELNQTELTSIRDCIDVFIRNHLNEKLDDDSKLSDWLIQTLHQIVNDFESL